MPLARSAYVWAFGEVHYRLRVDPLDWERLLPLMVRELDAIEDSVTKRVSWEAAEREILNERLMRRYDPGMALNEAFQRAIEAKKAAKQSLPMGLPGKQSMDYQEDYMRGILRQI